MKLKIPCIDCELSKLTYPKIDSIVEIRDDGFYKITCNAGHVTVIALEAELFEILFEIGANAIVDGYYRESVSSFAASLERFYEFYIKVISLNRGIDRNIFDVSWDLISQQSERQLGAFICLYTIEKKKSPILLNNTDVAFRNAVIHKGKIPSRTDAINYGSKVRNVIKPILFDLKDNYRKEINEISVRHRQEIEKKNITNEKFAQLVYPTIVNLTVKTPKQESEELENIINEMIKRKT